MAEGARKPPLGPVAFLPPKRWVLDAGVAVSLGAIRAQIEERARGRSWKLRPSEHDPHDWVIEWVDGQQTRLLVA